jgi:hypothetical protein
MDVKELPSDHKAKDEQLGPRGRATMQGITESTNKSEPAELKAQIQASRLSTETKQTLSARGLDDPDAILADNKGGQPEQYAQVVLKQEGLPMTGGENERLQDVVTGTYDGVHGFDLIGVAPDGRPIPIEVKKRMGTTDSVGKSDVSLGTMEPETLALKDDILRERAVNPALQAKAEQLMPDEPDPELSTEQMAGLWTRDRWLKLVKNEDHRSRLLEAGVAPEYLSLDNLKHAYSPQWRAILDGRTTVVVSDDRDGVTNTLMREAAFKRGFNVARINLKA